MINIVNVEFQYVDKGIRNSLINFYTGFSQAYNL